MYSQDPIQGQRLGIAGGVEPGVRFDTLDDPQLALFTDAGGRQGTLARDARIN